MGKKSIIDISIANVGNNKSNFDILGTREDIMETCGVCGEKCEFTAQMINIHTGVKKKICRSCLIKKMISEGQHN